MKKNPFPTVTFKGATYKLKRRKRDIVNYDAPYDNPCIGIIRYGKWEQDGSGGEYNGANCLGFYIERIHVVLREWESEDDIWWREAEHQKNISILCVNNIEVIGNIYDNPELLEIN